MKRTHHETPFLRRHVGRALTLGALGTAVAIGINSSGEETASYPQQPEYSCTDNPRAYVLQRIGEQSMTAVMGVREDNEDRQPTMGDLVTITGNKKEMTVMLPSGSRLVYPDRLEQNQSVELSDPTGASVRMAYVDGEPSIGIACSAEAWSGTVFDVNTDFVPLKPGE